MSEASIYRRDGRMRPAQRNVVDLGGGVGMVACFECDGTGWWAFMEPEIPGDYCVDCKGTGRRYLVFWEKPMLWKILLCWFAFSPFASYLAGSWLRSRKL